MTMNEDTQFWQDLIVRRRIDPKFKSRTCCIFNNNSKLPAEPDKLCPCGRMIRRHSLNGSCLQSKAVSEDKPWEIPAKFLDNITHSTPVPINIFGTLKPIGCKFVRIDSRILMKDLFSLLVEDCGGKKPDLIISVYGGAKYFTLTERLEKEFIRGIIEAATMADAWILTAGISNGVSKLVGEGISHYCLLRECPNKVKCIGMTMWGTINENTRLQLKKETNGYPPTLCERQIPDNAQEDKETVEQNHTHCILFDSGRLSEYLSDSHRSRFVTEACDDKDKNHTCYGVTIIVEGGLGSLEVLENDIESQRPTVLIQGSGRLADALATLVEQTSNSDRNQQWDPSQQEVEQTLDRFFPDIPDSDMSSVTKRIQKILKEEHRHLLHVFSLDRDKNVAETIFKAIFTATSKKNKDESDKKKKEANDKKKKEENIVINKEEKEKREREKKEKELLDEQQRRNSEDKLVNLALEWNYFDGVFPILQARQGEMVKKKSEFMTEDIRRQKELFMTSLEKNRPAFVEYFLSAGFDPLTLSENEDIHNYQTIILNLYNESHYFMHASHKHRVTKLFGALPLISIKQLDHKLNKLVGSFFGSIYSITDDQLINRIRTDLTNHIWIYACCECYENDIEDDKSHHKENINPTTKKYTKHHMLRDLFLWSIFMDMPEMAKSLLLHIRSRICAALIASAVFKKYSISSQAVDMKDKFRRQSLEFETYAGMSIDKCYEYNDTRACELLLRQIPLFGNVTCMQLAISSESGKVLETACFDQTLNQVWFHKLSLTNQQPSAKLLQVPSILTIGLLAPLIMTYREEETELIYNTKDEALSREGIDYYADKKEAKVLNCTTYWTRFYHFHSSPLVKMSYHFLSYIFFLLVFSYMMLYHLDGRNTFVIPNWTEIYVIITVSTMFCEEGRKLYHEYDARMMERWGSTGSSILTALTNVFYILPYFLFYLGLGFRYASYNDAILTTARIIWALDLELWYLRSLKFVIAFKFLGPKLFMLKNMLRDLFAFLYLIFIAICAYGVVSRALILYKQVPFTAQGIFSEIFYEPYWFIYGTVSDKDLLDELINNGTGDYIAEATATHVLLAFHMLFINILLLNLLIAVFANTIGKVQENTEFYWRYQRYSFVREYFERLPLSYPPLIIIPHLILLILTIQRKCCPKLFRNQVRDDKQASFTKIITPIFKMIPTKDSQNEQWDLFENAATHSYARSILEKNKNKDTSNTDDGKPRKFITKIDSHKTTTADDQQQTMNTFRDDLMTKFRAVLTENQKVFEQNNSKMENRLDEMTTSLKWMTDAIARVKMNDPREPKPTFESLSLRHDAPLANQPTTVTTNSAQ